VLRPLGKMAGVVALVAACCWAGAAAAAPGQILCSGTDPTGDPQCRNKPLGNTCKDPHSNLNVNGMCTVVSSGQGGAICKCVFH
jgi:hypothetical protein